MSIFKQMLFAVATVVLAGVIVARADDDDHERHSERRIQRRTVSAPTDSTYKAECASCHMLYPAGLLPARSWKIMMAGLKDHFGDNASLDKKTANEIESLLIENAADHSNLRRSKKIAKSIPSDQSPLRFTETSYFKRQHHEVGRKVWSRKSVGSASNCVACHSRAESGVFSEDEVKIPR